MKKSILSVLTILISSFFVYSQNLPCKEYFEDSRKCKIRYKEDNNGLIHGKYIEYAENQKVPAIVGKYHHGKKIGEWVIRGKSTFGICCSKATIQMANDQANGSYIGYDLKGDMYEKGHYSNNEKDGYWYENRKTIDNKYVYQEGTYVNGKRDGKWVNIKEEILTHHIYGDAKNYETEKGYYIVYDKGEIESAYSPDGTILKASRLYDDASSLEDYQYIKEHYPDFKYIDMVNSQIKKLKSEKKAAKALNDWDYIKKSTDPEKFKDFINNYPNSSKVGIAKKYIDESELYNRVANSKSKNDLKRYVDAYPNGRFVYEIKTKIAEVDARAAKSKTTLNAYENFVKNHPNHKNIVAEEHLSLAKKLNTKDAVQSFIDSHPSHDKQPEANELLHEIDKNEKILAQLRRGKKDPSFLKSLIIPGWGNVRPNRALGYNDDFPWLTTLTAYGGIGIGFYALNESQVAYNESLDVTDPEEQKQLEEESESLEVSGYVLIGLGAAMWAGDIINVMMKKAKIKRYMKEYENKLSINLDYNPYLYSNDIGLKLTYRF